MTSKSNRIVIILLTIGRILGADDLADKKLLHLESHFNSEKEFVKKEGKYEKVKDLFDDAQDLIDKKELKEQPYLDIMNDIFVKKDQ